MKFPKQEHWSGLPCPPPGDLSNRGLNLCLLHWQADSLPLKVKEENEQAGFKLNIQKTNIMASGPITSMANRWGKKCKQWQTLFSWASKSLRTVTAAMQLRDGCSSEEKLWQPNSVQFSHSVMSDSLQPHGLQHTRLPCPSPTPGACSNSGA